jgi:hypothetical protein
MSLRMLRQALRTIPFLLGVLLTLQASIRVTAPDYPFVSEQTDHWRIAGEAGLRPLRQPMNGRPLFELDPDPTWQGGFSSSASSFVRLAKQLSSFWTGNRGVLDVRAVGATYLAFLCIPTLLLFAGASTRQRWFLTLGLWAGTDPLILAYLNSIYGDPPILVSSCLCALLLVRWGSEKLPRAPLLALLCLATIIGALSKPQYSFGPGWRGRRDVRLVSWLELCSCFCFSPWMS